MRERERERETMLLIRERRVQTRFEDQEIKEEICGWGKHTWAAIARAGGGTP